MRLSTAVAIAALALPTAPLAGQTPAAVQEGRALRIGMIGAGAMGAPIGLALAEAGHQVMFSSRNPAELMPLVQQAAPRASAGYADAAAYFADVIFLAVPPSAIPQLGQDYGELMRGKIVIDLTNPRVDRDGEITNEWLAMGTGEAMAQYLPGTRFVKAFNTVAPRDFANPLRDGVRVGVPIASDDAEAAQVAAALVRDVGLDPVVVGPLSRAKEFDRGTSIWETGASAEDIREALSLR
jgi:predicted dinucleotide-binding enzyme